MRLFALLFTFAGCTQASAPAPPPPLAPPALDRGESERTLVGTLHTTKGAQLMLNGVIIPDHKLPQVTSDDPRAARKVWLGKRIEVRAIVRMYVCAPGEQCLMGGRIPLVKRILSIREVSP
jgi:hypothetical protein